MKIMQQVLEQFKQVSERLKQPTSEQMKQQALEQLKQLTKLDLSGLDLSGLDLEQEVSEQLKQQVSEQPTSEQMKQRLEQLKQQLSLTFTNQLIRFIPEDCVAELTALYHQLQAQNKSKWLIVITITWNLLGLFWAFYIQIKIENIWLAQIKIDE